MTEEHAPATPGEKVPLTDGDAATYLEALLGDAVPVAEVAPDVGPTIKVEMVGPHLRVSGQVRLGRYRRLSDVLNNQEGPLEIRDATVLYRNGNATRVVTPSLWVNLTEMTLMGQLEDAARPVASPEFRIPKQPLPLIVVTPGHTLTGDVFITVGAELSGFIESADPPFLPMTDVRTRSLADRRITSRYFFALLNRRHIVAATQLLPGMVPTGRTL